MSFTSQPTVTIQTDPPNLWFSLDGNRLLAPMVLTASRFSANQPHRLSAEAQQDCRTQCITGTRYLFRDWTDSAAADRTVTWDGRGNAVYTLRYRTQHQMSVFSGNTTRGTVRVEPAPSDGYYDEDSTIRLTAAPNSSSRFTGWQSGLLSLDLTAPDSANIVASCGNPWMYRINQPLTLFGYFDAPLAGATRPAITAAGVTNAASNQGGVAPGTILVLYGSNLGPSLLGVQTPTDHGFFDNCYAETVVSFDGTFAPIIYTSAGQLSAIAPYGIDGKSTTSVQVSYRGLTGNAVSVPVQRTAPALFTSNLSGSGQAAMFNQDGSVNSASNPADRGSIVVLFGTGEGQTNPAGVDGRLALEVYPKPVGQVSLRIGGVEAEILYAGAAPTLVSGVLQVNARVPASIAAGATVPVVLTVGGTSSRGDVTLAVR